MAIAVFEKLWAIPILVLVLASVLVAYSASATEVFQDTEKTIMNSTIKTVSSPFIHSKYQESHPTTIQALYLMLHIKWK